MVRFTFDELKSLGDEQIVENGRLLLTSMNELKSIDELAKSNKQILQEGDTANQICELKAQFDECLKFMEQKLTKIMFGRFSSEHHFAGFKFFSPSYKAAQKLSFKFGRGRGQTQPARFGAAGGRGNFGKPDNVNGTGNPNHRYPPPQSTGPLSTNPQRIAKDDKGEIWMLPPANPPRDDNVYSRPNPSNPARDDNLYSRPNPSNPARNDMYSRPNPSNPARDDNMYSRPNLSNPPRGDNLHSQPKPSNPHAVFEDRRLPQVPAQSVAYATPSEHRGFLGDDYFRPNRRFEDYSNPNLPASPERGHGSSGINPHIEDDNLYSRPKPANPSAGDDYFRPKRRFDDSPESGRGSSGINRHINAKDDNLCSRPKPSNPSAGGDYVRPKRRFDDSPERSRGSMVNNPHINAKDDNLYSRPKPANPPAGDDYFRPKRRFDDSPESGRGSSGINRHINAKDDNLYSRPKPSNPSAGDDSFRPKRRFVDYSDPTLPTYSESGHGCLDTKTGSRLEKANVEYSPQHRDEHYSNPSDFLKRQRLSDDVQSDHRNRYSAGDSYSEQKPYSYDERRQSADDYSRSKLSQRPDRRKEDAYYDYDVAREQGISKDYKTSRRPEYRDGAEHSGTQRSGYRQMSDSYSSSVQRQGQRGLPSLDDLLGKNW